MILLDLFCGAGGAAVGYSRAGFEVIGVDVRPQPNYPFAFDQSDAVDTLKHVLVNGSYGSVKIDAIHASPPCQRYSSSTANKDKHPDLVPEVQYLLRLIYLRWGIPYVIENVERSPLFMPYRLCGSGLGLGVRRHRLFETSFDMDLPDTCDHKQQGTPVGVYGDHADTKEYRRPDGTRRGSKARSLEEAQEAMGIDWMDWNELTEAIPPAYTHVVGTHLMRELTWTP